MIVDRPIKFREAIELLRSRQLFPTSLGSFEIEALDAMFRRHAMFSARVTDAHFLQRALDLVTQIVDPLSAGGAPGSYMDRATARLELKRYLASIGYTPEPGTEGTLKDLASDARTDLVVRMNTEMAQGLGQHIQANNPAVLDVFPCQELYRLENRVVPRDWPSRWRLNGGNFYDGGRMIARKDDPVWLRISRFGNPYPPYDYNSGMWVRPVARAESVRLGVIQADAVIARSPITAAPPKFTIQTLAPALQDALRETTGGSISDGSLQP